VVEGWGEVERRGLGKIVGGLRGEEFLAA